MILNVEDRDSSWFDRVFDVCVVGAGPAGITLSRQLASHRRDICLLEGGGRSASQESQELYRGDVIGFNYAPLDVTRLRFLGGTSNHWTGWCRPLDAWDFAAHAVNPFSGWPITKNDLDPYAQHANSILDIERTSDSAAFFPSNVAPFLPVDFHWSAPTRFGEKYAKELEISSRIRLCLNANLVGFHLDDARRRVTQLTFKSYDKEGNFIVKARHYVLCLGGIENPRALLNTHSEARHAIGNRYDQVGRNFCEHLHYDLGKILFQKKPSGPVFLGPSSEMMDNFRILNFGLRFWPPKLPDVAGSQRNKRHARWTTQDFVCSTSLTDRIAKAIGVNYDCNPLWRFKIASEQALNPDSRVVLTDATDRFGWRYVALDWRLSEVDHRTIRTAAEQSARLFASKDVGRIKLKKWVTDQTAEPPSRVSVLIGNHHMCTTRMSAHPRHGVVDGNCRVHDTDNLYIGGSSVFATGGHSNPTYTIVQLALRLGDHLHGRLG